MQTLRRHLTIANTLSVIALFVSLGGTVYAAGGGFSGKEVRPRSLPGNRLVPNSVTGKEVKESSLKNVPTAAAWGKVSAAGVLTEQHEVSSITHTPGLGLYCIGVAGRSPAAHPMLVTLDGSDGDTTIENGATLSVAQWFSAGSNCPPRAYEVRTADFQGRSNRLDSAFADNGFSFLVP